LRIVEHGCDLRDEIPDAVQVDIAHVQDQESFDIRAVTVAPSCCLINNEIFGACHAKTDSVELDLSRAEQCFFFERKPCERHFDRDATLTMSQEEHLTFAGELASVFDSWINTVPRKNTDGNVEIHIAAEDGRVDVDGLSRYARCDDRNAAMIMAGPGNSRSAAANARRASGKRTSALMPPSRAQLHPRLPHLFVLTRGNGIHSFEW
jgi:hypothetical protein